MWDYETTFSNRQTLATAASENIVDIGPDDAGRGEAVYLQVALSSGASGTLTVTLETADSEDMTGGVDRAVYLVDAGVVAKGGVVLAAPLPTGCGRFARLAYAGASGGTVTAGIVQAPQTNGMF